jgi:hypothetical protein
MNRDDRNSTGHGQLACAVLILHHPISVNGLFVIDANQIIRGLDELPGFAIQHPDGDGLRCLRAQAAATHGHAKQKGNPSMNPMSHFCLCDSL